MRRETEDQRTDPCFPSSRFPFADQRPEQEREGRFESLHRGQGACLGGAAGLRGPEDASV